MTTRQEAMTNLLRPIKWDWSSNIRARQNLVCNRHEEVRTVYQFMSDDEKKRADKWFIDEDHSELWD